MEKTEEQLNEELYIETSKKNINNYLYTQNYRSAFLLIILVLERLDTNQKNEFIKYYSDNLVTFMSFNNPIEGKNTQSQIYVV